MKKYNIGGSNFEIVAATILGVVMGIGLFFLTYNAFFSNEQFLFIPLFLIIIPVFCFVIIYLNISTRMGYNRMIKALSGHKGTGIVHDNYFTYSKNGRRLHIKIIYQTDSGEKVMLHTVLYPKYEKYFPIGKEIPLYINGEFGYFNKEEITKGNNIKNTNTESYFNFCPYCGFKLENNLERCQNCNAKVK